jgi:hypothetical protein
MLRIVLGDGRGRNEGADDYVRDEDPTSFGRTTRF